MSDFGFALQLMGIGMITVFIILSLVVLIGNLIIRFVNKYLPEEVSKKVEKIAEQTTALNRKKVAAIVSAVKTVTEGKGHVTKIEKMS
ncbi:OadG family protein [Sunxiuqinia elliptica]|uniref:Oxaloacetate decarboxylase gamma subunit n=1 Tax=Sunxiuqinia elliptica TaxID=655355 RepID=A0A1I2L992_9BACT|nr:OadG family transporter subunit [Sunxiuqinia elliptica]TDO03074.1 oxaloacetate decarboxylase gamma subunit [Sunxiuqinia elliptica]TDO59273.1 oxaloacetate decarboxylase gamma subunit [Sunxiuqinia elliptica]SFF75029.1 oxaloacetate decarboxylase, gamma subunit [Sunxiuqinia elliptica]